ncbi:MAG TPA: IscS subfamily cysteine desulfurase [Terriglobales bacterium]|nr:IscS subfamily cysteine desulfurase [Terriglobales bacterium]
MERLVYLDNHATTPIDPRVLEAMMPFLTSKFGNASSRSHRFGWEAEEAVEKARKQVADLLRASPKEIIFTSGATESINIAIKGAIEYRSDGRDHIVTTAIEHKAVLDTCKALTKAGKARVTYVGVDRDGLVDPDEIAKAIEERTALVSVMHANNEIGTLQPIAAIAAIAHRAGALFHTDAAQSAGKIPIDVDAMDIDLLSLSGHKMYAPKGCGALYVRARNRNVRLAAQMHGGGHERGLRSGTLNVPGIVALGAAAEIAARDMADEAQRIAGLRDRLRAELFERAAPALVNGHPELRLPGNLNLCFAYVDGESLMMALPDIAVSSGSACTSVTLEPSHVLRAIGLDEDQAHASLRFGVGRFTTADEIDYVVARVAKEIARLRRLSAEFAAAQRQGSVAMRSAT